MAIKTSLITTEDEFASLEREWNELAEKVAHPQVFSRWEWNWLYYKHLCRKDRLFLVVAREKAKIVGLAPLRLVVSRKAGKSVKVLRPLVGDDVADFHSFLIRADQSRREIIRKILQELHEHRGEWDVLHLTGFSSRDSAAMHIASVVREFDDLKCMTEMAGRNAYLDYGSSHRLEGRRAQRLKAQADKLSDTGFRIRIGIEDTEALWSAFRQLHAQQWKPSLFTSTPHLSFFDELRSYLRAAGMLEFSAMERDGKLIAAHFGFKDGLKIYHYMTTFDGDFRDLRVGMILTHLMTEHYAPSHKEFDFLRGDEEYKYWWTDDAAVNFELRMFYRTNVSALLYNFGPTVANFVGSSALPGLIRQRIKNGVKRVRAKIIPSNVDSQE